MNARNSIIWACLAAAGTTQAHADIFTWFNGTGMWEDPAMWNGPAGQYPDSILDTATLSGQNVSATLGQNLALGTLNILNGAQIYSNGHSIFVNADTQISGFGSAISVSETPSLRDFDTDTLTMDSAFLAMYGGLAQIDEALIINNGSAVIGAGTIEMNSTTGNIVLNDGALWAQGGGSIGDTLHITRTNSSTSKLNWTSANAGIIVWDGKTLHNELPYTGALGGRISVLGYSGTARFISNGAFVAGNTSEVVLSGLNSQSTARIEAPAVDSYGLLTITSNAVINSPFVALRGDVEMREDAFLSIPATVLIFDALNITSNAPDTKIQLAELNSTLNVIGGLTSIVLDGDSEFDLDGTGDKIVNIANGSTLSLDVGEIEIGNFPSFGGTLNIDGTLHIESHMGSQQWRSHGEIALDQGTITGRRIENAGVIRGTGTIDAYVINNGEIIADGGTLQLGSVNMDGDSTPETGILRAQTGDLVLNMQSNGGTHQFTGSIFVGDGVGVRETFNADVDLILRDIDGVRGSMHMNSGFILLEDFLSYGDVSVDGTSLLRTTGTNDADRISFVTGSMTTIDGTLEVDGRTWFTEGAQFSGSGTIDAVSTVKGTFFQDGADLNGVGLISSGEIHLVDFFEGTASVHALTMRDSASLHLSMWYSDQQQQIMHDTLNVQDQAVLDGTLVLSLNPETDLPVGETITMLQADSISGNFDAVDDSQLGPNRRAYVTITDTAVEVFVTCATDLNADGQSNFFDVSMFLAQYNAMDPQADLNNDGQLNFFDVSIFLSNYDMGC